MIVASTHDPRLRVELPRWVPLARLAGQRGFAVLVIREASLRLLAGKPGDFKPVFLLEVPYIPEGSDEVSLEGTVHEGHPAYRILVDGETLLQVVDRHVAATPWLQRLRGWLIRKGQ